MPKVYSRFNTPPIDFTTNSGECLVDQEAAQETDVNRIMARLGVPGVEELMLQQLPEQTDQDFSMYRDMDMPAMLRQVNNAAEQYAALPAPIRQRFGGLEDFVDVCTNPERINDAIAAGIYSVNEDGEITAAGKTLDVNRPTDTKVKKKARKKAEPKVEVGNKSENADEGGETE